MKKSEIVVGGHYLAKVSNVITTVRVDAIREIDGCKESAYSGRRSTPAKTRYDVTNLRTGRTTTFDSAMKFRESVPTCDTCGKAFTRFRGDKPDTCLTCLEGGDRSSLSHLNGDQKRRVEQIEAKYSTEAGATEEERAEAQALVEGEQRPDPTAPFASTPVSIKTIQVDKPTADSAEELSHGASEPPTTHPDDDRTTGVRCPRCGRGEWDVRRNPIDPAEDKFQCKICGEHWTRYQHNVLPIPPYVMPEYTPKSPRPTFGELYGGAFVANQQAEMVKAVEAAGGEVVCQIQDEIVMMLPNSRKADEQRLPPTVTAVGSPTSAMPSCSGSSSSPSVSSVFGRIADAIKFEADAPHVQLKALAGTGKTTSCIEGLKHVKGLGTSITPSSQQAEFWRVLGLGRLDSVRLSAFNTSITDELKGRLAACGLDKMGVEARGVHSLGNAAVYKAFGRLQASDWTTKDLVCEALGKDFHDLKKQPGMLTLINAASELVSLCKQNLCEPTPEELDRLASHYDVDTDKQMSKVCEIVPTVLEASKSPKGRIHFDDMVWLPIVLGLPIPQVDVQVIDEQQDLNRMQQELIYRAGRRIVGVGDEHQAIYGFAGADAESMNRMATTLAGTSRGCTVLPLTVTRRCGKAIVREAQRWVPEYEAHQSNCEGSVDEARYPIQKNAATGRMEDLPWDETYLRHVRDGAMVLCRVNAPLVSQCFRFLKRGIKAFIMGRKIGEGLVSLIEKSKQDAVSNFLPWLQAWTDKEVEVESKKKFPSETKLGLIADKADCLISFCDGQSRMTDVVAKIKSVFTDAKEVRGVRLASIHKSKGLEADQVFFLQPKGGECPHPMAKSAWQRQQERNLAYVASTRAIRELWIVR